MVIKFRSRLSGYNYYIMIKDKLITKLKLKLKMTILSSTYYSFMALGPHHVKFTMVEAVGKKARMRNMVVEITNNFALAHQLSRIKNTGIEAFPQSRKSLPFFPIKDENLHPREKHRNWAIDFSFRGVI